MGAREGDYERQRENEICTLTLHDACSVQETKELLKFAEDKKMSPNTIMFIRNARDKVCVFVVCSIRVQKGNAA